MKTDLLRVSYLCGKCTAYHRFEGSRVSVLLLAGYALDRGSTYVLIEDAVSAKERDLDEAEQALKVTR
jgi:hypothetical protein